MLLNLDRGGFYVLDSLALTMVLLDTGGSVTVGADGSLLSLALELNREESFDVMVRKKDLDSLL